MTDERTLSRWRDAALDGSFSRIEGMLGELVQANWPEHKGQFFLREYGLPTGFDAGTPEYEAARAARLESDNRRYQDFVTKLYLDKFDGGRGPRGLEIAELRAQAAGLGASLLSSTAYDGDMGWQNYQLFSVNGPVPLDFKVSLLNLNAGQCKHCTSTLATRSQTMTCDVVRPDAVFADRMDYFNTVTHELAHGLRAVGPDFRNDTPEEMRKEEGIAKVFAALMTIQVFGTAGMTYVRGQIGEFGTDPERRFVNDASLPLRAALDYATANSGPFRQQSPRDLFALSEQIVAQHDVVRGMSFIESAVYERHLKDTPTDFNALAAKVEPLLDPANWAQAVARHKRSPLERDESLPFAAATVFQVEAYTRELVQLDLLNMGMRQNPLRPHSMRSYNAHTEDMLDPKVARDLQAFHARHNPSFCPPLVAQPVEYENEDGTKGVYGEAVSPPLGPPSSKHGKPAGPS
jgi:hypothetical protein